MTLLLIFSIFLNLLLAVWLIVWRDRIDEQSIFIEEFKHRERRLDNWHASDAKIWNAHVANLEAEIVTYTRSSSR